MELSVPVDNEVKLNVRHRPGGDGRPFVLAHGLGSNARLWDETAELLAAAGHPVYAVDMRGHGDSEEPEHGYDNATAVADLVAICRELDLAGVLLAGHSWGGNLSVRLSVEHPGLVTGLALVDGGWVNLTDTANWEISWEACAEFVMQRRPDNTGATAETMRRFLRALHPSWSEGAVEASLGDMREGPDGLLVPQPSATHYLEIVRSMWDDPPGPWQAQVRVPVMLLNAIPPA
ncbi:alpha/beta hydrolase, partial [Streptomyces sp. MCAF7]